MFLHGIPALFLINIPTLTEPSRHRQTEGRRVDIGAKLHTIQLSDKPAPKAMVSDPISTPIHFSLIPLQTQAIRTQGELAQAQQKMLDIALTALNNKLADTPHETAAVRTQEILQQLHASLDPKKLSQPDEPPSTASIEMAHSLLSSLATQLEKAGIKDASKRFTDTPPLSFPTSRSTSMLAQLQAKQIDAALRVLQEHDQAARINHQAGGLHTDRQKLDTAIQTLAQLQKSVLQTVAHKGDGEASIAQLNAAKKLEKDLIALLANQIGKPPLELRAQWRENFTTIQNEQEWKPVQTSLVHQGKTYLSTHIPAGHMKLGEQPLLPSYQGKGYSSASTKETQHAVNLWASTFSTDSQVLFKGVRHAILSPFGLKKDSPERVQGAINRAQEVVIAALALDPDKLTAALNGTTVNLRLASTSLVTAIDLPGTTEGTQIKDQIAAWQQLTASPPLKLQVPDAQGVMQTISINVEVAAFNFGVNEVALKLGPFGLGWKQADTYNAVAFPQLLGSLNKKDEIGGWAKEFLDNAAASADDKVFVRELVSQIRDIWASQSHHYDANEPYKMATRVGLLAHTIGATPAWNCKSGKDRTGMLDTEIKNALIQRQENLTLSAPGAAFSDTDKALYRKALAQTGNLEIQQYNTGVQGNKVLTTHFLSLSLIKERIGDDKHTRAMHGLSFLVKS